MRQDVSPSCDSPVMTPKRGLALARPKAQAARYAHQRAVQGQPGQGRPWPMPRLTREGPGRGRRQAADPVRVRLLPDCCQSREASFARAVFTMLTY